MLKPRGTLPSNTSSYYDCWEDKLESEDVDQRTSMTASEIERLLGEPRLGLEDDDKKYRPRVRAQRVAENGETLRYIELVLRQLRRASRDHQQLVEERHRIDAERPLRESSATRLYPSSETWIPARRNRHHERTPWERPLASRSYGRREEESLELVEFAGFDVATKLLTKRKTYGTGFNILETMPSRIHERPSISRQGFRHVPGYAGIDTAIIQ